MKKLISFISVCLMLLNLMTPAYAEDEAAKVLAFPGAEGGGKYTQGARAGEAVSVYHVTSLEAEGEGTFADAVSQSNRIIVFDVGGIIQIPKKIKITADNLTILGQTAPGDGITIAGADIELAADNLIIRYLRVRPSDQNGGEPDGLGGRWLQNVIVDHCSVSWGVDELLTVYSGTLEDGKTPSQNITVQYCLSSESLRMSNHIKGAHGYGGIVGGTNATYHHNLFAHNDSRNPRLDRNLKSTDLVNNVIYDYGNNTCYGGEPYSYNKVEEFSKPAYASNVNIRGCYYKYGPSTVEYPDKRIRGKIFEATNDGTVSYEGKVLKSNFYIEDNYVYGYEDVTADNWLSEESVQAQALINRLEEPVDMGEYAIEMQSAQDAYETVLANVGATLPKRDSVDARVIADVKNGTGRIINAIAEAGGYPEFQEVTRVFAIGEEWKQANAMGEAAETDIVPSGKWRGYTWIEAYVNDMTEQQSAPTNPEITVISPVIGTTANTIDKTDGNGTWPVIYEDETILYQAKAAAAEGTAITSMTLSDGGQVLAAEASSELKEQLSLKPGIHYLMSRAYNDKGEMTDSPVSIVYVKGCPAEDWKHTQIGNTSFDHKGGIWKQDGVYTIGGSGVVGGVSDACDFSYRQVQGDFDFTVKVENIPKYENGVLAGLMVREGLDGTSRQVMLSDGWIKGGENIKVIARTEPGAEAAIGYMKDQDGKDVVNSGNSHPVPAYLRIERKGDVITLSVSDDGNDFTGTARKPYSVELPGLADVLYVGMAVDSMDGVPVLPYFTNAAFLEVTLNQTGGCTVFRADYENGALHSVSSEKMAYADAAKLTSDANKRYWIIDGLNQLVYPIGK